MRSQQGNPSNYHTNIFAQAAPEARHSGRSTYHPSRPDPPANFSWQKLDKNYNSSSDPSAHYQTTSRQVGAGYSSSMATTPRASGSGVSITPSPNSRATEGLSSSSNRSTPRNNGYQHQHVMASASPSSSEHNNADPWTEPTKGIKITTTQRSQIALNEPRLDPKPKPKIRIGVTDDELNAIWREDDRKAKAANAMETHGNDPVNAMFAAKYNYPHELKEQRTQKIKVIGPPQPKVDAPGLPGLAGMGAYSPEDRRHGKVHLAGPETVEEKPFQRRPQREPPRVRAEVIQPSSYGFHY